jgi:hypothetical protein
MNSTQTWRYNRRELSAFSGFSRIYSKMAKRIVL